MSLVVVCLSLYLLYITKIRDVDTACGIPGRPSGGQVLQRNEMSFEDGDIVTYWCSETDYLLGSVNRTCGANGKWTDSVPICLSPAMVKEPLQNKDLTTKVKNEKIDAQRSFFLDQNTNTCVRPFNHEGLRMHINFILKPLLVGVRVVFPTQNNHTFRVYSVPYKDSRIQCDELGSGKMGQSTKYQVTLGCSSKNGAAERVSLFFDETPDELSICEIYLFFLPDDKKCGTPDAPLNGKIQPSSTLNGEYFSFLCDPGFELSGSIYTVCAANRSWTQNTPACIKKYEQNYSFSGNNSLHGTGNQEKEENHTVFVYQIVSCVLGIIVIAAIATALYCVHRRRKENRRYNDRPSYSSHQSSQGANSFDVSVRREPTSSPRHLNNEFPEQQERPRSHIPDILDHEIVRSLKTVPAIDIPHSRACSTSAHIYDVPVYEELEGKTSKIEDRKRKSDFVLIDNDLYSTNT